MDHPGISIRTSTADDWADIWRLIGQVFHHTHEEGRELEASVFEPGRGLVATDGELIVGSAAAYTRDLTVPGAIVPAAHVTLVGVAPTHRRRGLLRRMMHRQLGDIARAGGEPIAVLWASESAIYPRFGYGLAAHRLRMDIMTREIRMTTADDTTGTLRMVTPADTIADFTQVYERLRPARPGWSSRDERWWRLALTDLPGDRGDGTALRGVVYNTADGPQGYALWRTFDGWNQHGPAGRVDIREVAADDPVAYAALWRFLLTLDLTSSAKVHFAALDEPLQHIVDDPRRLGTEIADALWVRVINLPAALAARRYRTELDVVLDVTDPLLPHNTGRWRLTAGPGTVTCRRTDDPADLACTVLELGAAYLGGTSLTALAAAGRVRELTPGALNRASTAFGAHRMPNPIEVF